MWEYWVAGGIVALGLILFFFLMSRTSYKQPTVQETSGIGEEEPGGQYKRMRDEATLDEADAEEEDFCAECEVPMSECECEEEEYDSNNYNVTATGSSMSSTLGGFFKLALFAVPAIIIAVMMMNVVNTPSGPNVSYSSQDFKAVVVDGLGVTGQMMVEWLDLIVLLIVLGFIIGVFVKVGNLFDTGPYEDTPTRKRSSPKQKNKAIKHYEGMRNEMTSASAKRDKAKLDRLRREGEQ